MEMAGSRSGKFETESHTVLQSVTFTTLLQAFMAESEGELKSLQMKVKEESGKSWLKAQHSENEDHGIWSPLLHGK